MVSRSSPREFGRGDDPTGRARTEKAEHGGIDVRVGSQLVEHRRGIRGQASQEHIRREVSAPEVEAGGLAGTTLVVRKHCEAQSYQASGITTDMLA
jgi:hypothetical protein